MTAGITWTTPKSARRVADGLSIVKATHKIVRRTEILTLIVRYLVAVAASPSPIAASMLVVVILRYCGGLKCVPDKDLVLKRLFKSKKAKGCP